MWMRGGTSKGGYFLKDDLPADVAARDAFLLRIMGSPDLRQIDGMGGADPLTSKVALVSKSARPGVDVDYLFLQIFVDQATVSDAQNCGNILAGIGPFAIERGLVTAAGDETLVAIFMENTGQIAVATVATPGSNVIYAGEARIDGVPDTAAPIPLEFRDTAGSSCGALLPTGNAIDMIDGVACTLIDNGMPCVVLAASDVGATGFEDRDTLGAERQIASQLVTEKQRLQMQIDSLSRQLDTERGARARMTAERDELRERLSLSPQSRDFSHEDTRPYEIGTLQGTQPELPAASLSPSSPSSPVTISSQSSPLLFSSASA